MHIYMIMYVNVNTTACDALAILNTKSYSVFSKNTVILMQYTTPLLILNTQEYRPYVLYLLCVIITSYTMLYDDTTMIVYNAYMSNSNSNTT